MIPEKKQKLSKKAFQDLIALMRRWPRVQLDHVAPLIWHLRSLEAEIEKLAEENRSLRQQSFMEASKKIEEKLSSEISPIKPSYEKYPLIKRLALMEEQGLVDSEQWKLALKYNGLSHDEALAKLFEYHKNPVDNS